MRMLDESKGAVPLYAQIYQDLKEKIESKEYEYGWNIQPGTPVMKRVTMSLNRESKVQECTLSYYNAARYTHVILVGAAR